MLYRQYTDEDNNLINKYQVIDDKTIDKPTLALRRLHLAKMEVNLKKLSKAIFFLADFIKLAHRNTWFIDSNGEVFQYKKGISLKLTFKKIKHIIPISTGGAIIEVEGIPSRFKTLHNPDPANRYAGLLEHGMGYILYGLYETKLPDSRRMI